MHFQRATMVAISIVLAACGGDEGVIAPDNPGAQRSGVAQKGPVVGMSTVTVDERDATLTPTGNSFTASTGDDTGAFSLSGVGITSPYADVVVRGFYYDEVGGSLAGDEVTLRALVDATAPLVNVNAITTMSRPRILNLVGNGAGFSAASLQAKDEVLTAFGIAPQGAIPASSLTIADAGPANAALLAVSATLQHAARLRADGDALVTAQLNDLFQSIATDLEPDGTIDDVPLANEITQAARSLDAAAVRQNLEDYYAGLGVPVTIPAFESLLPVASGQFVAATPLSMPRAGHSATLLDDGGLLITSGFTQTVIEDAFIYDPVAESQGPAIQVGTAFSLPKSVKIGDRVYFFGATNDGTAGSAVYVYDTLAGSFAPVPAYDLPGPKQSFWIAAVALQSGNILAIRNQGGDQVEEVLDPMMGTITPTNATVSSHRWDSPGTLLADSRVLFAGGSCCGMPDQVLGSAELFFASTNGWGGTASSLTTSRTEHSQTLLDDGRVLIVGGLSNMGPTGTIEIFDPAQSSISVSAASLATPRRQHTATKLADGRVLIVGGYGAMSTVLSSAEIYDPITDSVASVSASLADARVDHTATLLPDGTVLFVGGGGPNGALASVERFIP